MDKAGMRKCPNCGSDQYAFSGRRKVPAAPEKGEPAATVTTYRCKACEHKWKVRVADAGPGPAASAA